MSTDTSLSGAVEPAPQTSPDALAAALKARILSGALPPGQRLIEMDLAEEFGTGRGRVREAFRVLVGEGYLEFVANRGVLVRRYSRAEMLAMGRTREVLEGLAARMAAERRPQGEERQGLETLQARMDVAEAAVDLDAFNIANREYHSVIARLSRNGHVVDFLDRVRVPLVRLQLPRSFAADSIGRSNSDHRVITAAILSGAPEAAEAAMRAHVQAGNAHIASLPDEVFR